MGIGFEMVIQSLNFATSVALCQNLIMGNLPMVIQSCLAESGTKSLSVKDE